jgi:hypothetical protein
VNSPVPSISIGSGITLVRSLFERWSRRGRVHRQLEQIRSDINNCAAIFVASTLGGTVPLIPLPTQSTALLAVLHSDGFLTNEELEVLRRFFSPAERSNFWLSAPEQPGPPGTNGVQRLMSLLQGKKSLELLPGCEATLRDLALAAIASAVTRIERQRWRPW